ncbi:DUF551 domain-containing protein [Escherichia coli]|uniref:DUF551 domain-containing protein n=1 Tax=Escherichia coli TaxID=562 RepID=UPI000A906E07|nr:DUF551 domain-containing protein [Escherichia coli]EMC1808334.1 DUF551 domain-containing protein [Escherichia coli]NJX04933.1 DUF551 domain-containing protein [Escherichia coli]HCN0076756.1 DUF551 domain-containing protein [Escherichia coli]
MTTNNHPAHGPVSLERLHQISEILSKAAAQSDGGNLGYAMADAVKVIDVAIAEFGAEPVAVNDDMAYAFHHALSDSSLGTDEVEEIKIGLRAAFANIAAPQTAPVVSDIDTIALNTARNVMCDINRMEGWPGGDVQLLAHIQSRIEQACRAAMLQGADSNSPVIPDGWIPVSERVPEQYVEVMVCTDAGSRYIAALNRQMNWDDGDFFDYIQNVTHWMPLPVAPQQEVK